MADLQDIIANYGGGVVKITNAPDNRPVLSVSFKCGMIEETKRQQAMSDILLELNSKMHGVFDHVEGQSRSYMLGQGKAEHTEAGYTYKSTPPLKSADDFPAFAEKAGKALGFSGDLTHGIDVAPEQGKERAIECRPVSENEELVPMQTPGSKLPSRVSLA